MKKYVDKVKLQEFVTKLTTKYKTIFALKSQVGSPSVAYTPGDLLYTNRVYVYTGTNQSTTFGDFIFGHWYYYDSEVLGGSWVDGGVYNSLAFTTDTSLTTPGAAADAEATGNAIDEVYESIPQEKSMSFDVSLLFVDKFANSTPPCYRFMFYNEDFDPDDWAAIKDHQITKITINFGGVERDIINETLDDVYSSALENQNRYILPIKPFLFENSEYYGLAIVAAVYDNSAVMTALDHGDYSDATQVKFYWKE